MLFKKCVSGTLVPHYWIIENCLVNINTDEELKFLQSLEFELTDPRIRAGKDGYIVERKGKKLRREEVEKIKNDTGSYREKAEKYNISKGTISKIMNYKY